MAARQRRRAQSKASTKSEAPTIGNNRTTAWQSPWVVIALLIVVFGFAASTRSRLYCTAKDFDPKSDVGVFWTENAFHYRYARMASQTEIPRLDRRVQWPSGLDLSLHITLFMEYIAGYLYRLLGGGLPFHVFLAYVVCATAALAIFPVFGLAEVIWKNRWAGLYAAAIYAVAIPSFVRIRGTYPREHLGLPLIFFSLWALAYAGKHANDRWSRNCWSLIGGVFLALALVAWHLTRAYVSVFSLVVGLTWIWLSTTGRPQLVKNTGAEASLSQRVFSAGSLADDRANRFSECLLWMILPVVLVCFASPLLRARGFFWHPAVLAIAVIGCSSYVSGWHRRLALIGFVVVGALVVRSVLPLTVEQDSHVSSLLLAKFRHLGIKPRDPGQIPYEARFLWMEAFNGPDLLTTVYGYATVPLLALAAIASNVRHWLRETEMMIVLTMLLTAAFLSLFLLIARMTGFVVFFLCVWSGGALLIGGPRRSRWLCLIVACGCLGFETHKFLNFGEQTAYKRWVDSVFPNSIETIPNYQFNTVSLVDWVRDRTAESDPIVGGMGTSPVILAATNRPIVLQSKAENEEIRRRLREYYQCLYDSETAFHDFCRRYDARYFIYQADMTLARGPDSDRYLANALQLPLASAAWKFHFLPRELELFDLVYQDAFFRVYRVLQVNEEPERGYVPYQPTYDLSLFGDQNDSTFDDSMTESVCRRVASAVQHFRQSRQLLRQGREKEALREARHAAKLNPGLVGIHAELAKQLANSRSVEQAVQHGRIAVQNYPASSRSHYANGYALGAANRPIEAYHAWQLALQLDPDNAELEQKTKKLQQMIQDANANR